MVSGVGVEGEVAEEFSGGLVDDAYLCLAVSGSVKPLCGWFMRRFIRLAEPTWRFGIVLSAVTRHLVDELKSLGA